MDRVRLRSTSSTLFHVPASASDPTPATTQYTGTNRTYRIGTPYCSNRIVLLLPHDLYQPLRRRKRHCGDLRPRKESRHPPPFARTDRYGEPESPAVVESFRVARSTRTYRSGRVRSRPRRTRRGARHRKLSENHLHAAVRLQSGRSRQSVQFINQFINKKTNPNDDNAYEEQIRSAPPDRNAPHRHRPAGSFRIHLQSGRNPHPGQIAVSLHPDRPASGNRQKNRLPGKRRLRPTARSRWGSHRFQDGSRHRPALSYTSQWYL